MSRTNKQEKAQGKAGPFRFRIVEDDGRNVTFEVAEEDYRRDLAAGIPEDELLKPGRHRGVRGGFHERHNVTPEEVRAAEVKVHISIKLDADVLEYFKARAARPGAAPYQTQINSELRRVMERDGEQAAGAVAELVDDERFIGKLAQRIAEHLRHA